MEFIIATSLILGGMYLYRRSRGQTFAGDPLPTNINARKFSLDSLTWTVKKDLSDSFLKDYLNEERYEFEAAKLNIEHLLERYKHNKEELLRILDDAEDHMRAMKEIIDEREISDVADDEGLRSSRENAKKAWVRIIEINKRYEALLGEDYVTKQAESGI